MLLLKMQGTYPSLGCADPTPANGTVLRVSDDPDEDGIYPIGTAASLRCNNGYVAFGSTFTICQSPGFWDLPAARMHP